ncbi:Uncharacterized protein YqkB [Oceanobacillus limi]|uniref:Uncharacterized protein YqkB n=1 Tax=Oceanobacillus limi TaxID=930131 RepID=A0A1H9ZL19_9BACI|nr:iron-sulfur cluster biosynthesis family protein [Oceanobacillus limi]SES82035.1 Uncharacterized protein YqkB [Oceanobacillus limi]
MELTVTNNAIEKMKEIDPSQSYNLLLWYDTDECGCGVNGMPTFRLTKDPKNNNKKVNSNYTMPTYISEQQAVFFSKDMKLDYQGSTFRLISKEGILNPFISTTSIVVEG